MVRKQRSDQRDKRRDKRKCRGADENRTRNLLIWSQTRYHCATTPMGLYCTQGTFAYILVFLAGEVIAHARSLTSARGTIRDRRRPVCKQQPQTHTRRSPRPPCWRCPYSPPPPAALPQAPQSLVCWSPAPRLHEPAGMDLKPGPKAATDNQLAANNHWRREWPISAWSRC